MLNLQRLPDVANGEDLSRKISNSEVDAFLTCERKYYYAHGLNVEPKNTSTSLSRGIIGHEVLAEYYEHLMNHPGEYEKAEYAGRAIIHKYLQTSDPFAAEMLYDLDRIILRYFDYARGDEWEILAVERAYSIPINDDFQYAMRLDLLARIDGEITVVDHKFVYDFKSQDAIDMNVQMPKYLGTMRFNGINATGAILNQVRHRLKKGPMTDDEMFRRSRVHVSQVEIRNVLRDQIVASERIIERRALSREEHAKVALRVSNEMICKNCSMLPLCKAERMGGDITNMLAVDYRPNTYGYNNAADE